jgi:hypothetical protein
MHLAVSFVETEGELRNIAREVLGTARVIHAVEAAFQHWPYVFNGVSVRHAIHELLGRVID